jgi:hypothetical protein
MRDDTAIWVLSWPKKAAAVPTDLTEMWLREIALPLGLVDVQGPARSMLVWSALKLVVRRGQRRAARSSP